MTFFNIFSSKKEKIDSRQRIVIDNREKNSLVPTELAKLGFEIEFKHLPVADYLIKETAIERKSINDLKSSIINKRIFSQMIELKQYPQYLLIIEGRNDETLHSGIIHENALRGFMLAAALEYKIPVICSENEKETAVYISLLARKPGNKEISLRAKKLSFSKAEQVQYILEGFPSIGPAKAKALIKKLTSIKNIVNASDDELEEVLGKRAKEFRKLLD